jgi:hypothetical protein
MVVTTTRFIWSGDQPSLSFCRGLDLTAKRQQSDHLMSIMCREQYYTTMTSLRSVDSLIARIFTAFGSDKPYKVYCVTSWVIIVIMVTETKLTKDELQ